MAEEGSGRQRTKIDSSLETEDQKFSYSDPKPNGRHSKAYELIPRKDILLANVRKGMSLSLAAASAGLTEAAVRNCARDHETFALELAEARTSRIGQVLSVVNSLADNANSEAIQLKAAVFLLKNLAPKDFGDNKDQEEEHNVSEAEYRYL